MAFELRSVVPWGRSFDEYVAMFSLGAAELSGSILGCGDGPASFNAVAARRGCRVISADPLYQSSAAEIRARIAETAETIAEQTRRNADEFVWTRFRSVDELVGARLEAMGDFLSDFPQGRQTGRYVVAALPRLPFADESFDLALCSHFLFLYSGQYDLRFHVESLVELRRVSREVRVFPLHELGSVPSRHVAGVIRELEGRGYRAERVGVAYEVQRNAREMLRIV